MASSYLFTFWIYILVSVSEVAAFFIYLNGDAMFPTFWF